MAAEPPAAMTLRLPPYQPLPPPEAGGERLEVAIADLQPTQLCVGLAEVRSRQTDFERETADQRSRYLRHKPVPLVRSGRGELWMVDRHHRLSALLAIDPEARAYGYVALELPALERQEVLAALDLRGWLYLHDGRGRGPLPATDLPARLGGLHDDPFRSLVWKLKKEGLIDPQPLVPFHEFRWGAWLRTRPLPPFSSDRLDPALPSARALVGSGAAAHLAGWRGSG
jgi:hypothetical protein